MKANKWKRNNNRIMVMMIRMKEVFREVLRAVFLKGKKKMRKRKGRMGTVKWRIKDRKRLIKRGIKKGRLWMKKWTRNHKTMGSKMKKSKRKSKRQKKQILKLMVVQTWTQTTLCKMTKTKQINKTNNRTVDKQMPKVPQMGRKEPETQFIHYQLNCWNKYKICKESMRIRTPISWKIWTLFNMTRIMKILNKPIMINNFSSLKNKIKMLQTCLLS